MPYIKADCPTNVSPYKIIHPDGNDRRQTSFCYGIKIIPTSRINLGGRVIIVYHVILPDNISYIRA
jgi:hypothetical protein